MIELLDVPKFWDLRPYVNRLLTCQRNHLRLIGERLRGEERERRRGDGDLRLRGERLILRRGADLGLVSRDRSLPKSGR